MDEIKIGGEVVTASMAAIERSVGAAVSGLEKARAVIAGIYDDLILWERESEYWQKKSFDLRADEIERLRRMGQISAEEEAQLWRELFDQKAYGWQNVRIAEENYHKAMFEHSKQWIEEQTALGKLSAQEVAEAWQRVFDTFDDINIKYRAALEIREALLGEADDDTADRRRASDRWMRRQDLYDGGDPDRRFEDYTRRIAAEKALLKEIESGYLNGVELGTEEQAQRWAEVYEYIEDLEDARYAAAKERMEQQAADYINTQKAAITEQYNARLALYDSELSALQSRYEKSVGARRDRAISDEIAELEVQKKYYQNAVTKEGQERYKQITDRIKALRDEQDALEEKAAYREQEAEIRDKITTLRAEYQSSLADLERTKNGMLELAASALQQGGQMATGTQSAVSEALLGIGDDFASRLLQMFELLKDRIAEQIAGIASLLGSVGVSDGSSSETSVTVTLNDYGDKNLASGEAVVGYATELYNLFKNVFRVQGIK